MKKFAAEQIKKFFETGQWALKLIFLVVLVELGIVTGALIGLAGPLAVSYTHLTLPTTPYV